MVCTVLNCTVAVTGGVYCTLLFYTVLYCSVLYCTVLYCTVTVTDGVTAAEWEAAIYRESEELRRLVDPEDETEGDLEDENSLQGRHKLLNVVLHKNILRFSISCFFADWESVAADDFSEALSSSPTDRTLER